MKALIAFTLLLSSGYALACEQVELNVECESGCSLAQSNNANTLALAVEAAQEADACANSLITIYKTNHAPAGYINVYHYFQTTSSPVVSSANLEDLGWERWTENIYLPPPPPLLNDMKGWWMTGQFWLQGQAIIVCASPVPGTCSCPNWQLGYC
jgi:hypothetical protein